MAPGKVYVIGVGMTKFYKPGTKENFDYPDMSKEAVSNALGDASIAYSDVKQACVGYLLGDSASGQRCLYQHGMTGIPIHNVHNNGATGSTAVCLAKQLVDAGSDCVLVLAFEKMQKGDLGLQYFDRTLPVDRHLDKFRELCQPDDSPLIPQLYGNAGIEHMEKFGTTREDIAKIAYANRKNGQKNPTALTQPQYTLQDILDSPKVSNILTRLECCPKSDGAAAVVLASEDFVRRRGLEARAVEVLAIEMATDLESTFSGGMMSLIGYHTTALAARRAYERCGRRPAEVDVAELQDCFAPTQLVMAPALGLGAGAPAVLNPGGGLLGRGHPMSATGVAQCVELVAQLRGEAGSRQVAGARLALQHNFGLGGAAVVALYQRGFPVRRPVPVSKL